MRPKGKARISIDAPLAAAGWHVCDMGQANIHAARGIATLMKLRGDVVKRSRKFNLDFAAYSAGFRAKAEVPFRVIKRQFGHVKVRYSGLMQKTVQLQTLFALSNLWMARHRLLQRAQG